MDERSERKRKRLAAMSGAAPGIEAEVVYFMASSLVQSAVESVVEAEAEVLAAAVAKAVAKALPQVVDVEVEYDAYKWPDIDLGDGLAQCKIEVGTKDVAEHLAQWASEHAPEIVEALVKSAGENT